METYLVLLGALMCNCVHQKESRERDSGVTAQKDTCDKVIAACRDGMRGDKWSTEDRYPWVDKVVIGQVEDELLTLPVKMASVEATRRKLWTGIESPIECPEWCIARGVINLEQWVRALRNRSRGNQEQDWCWIWLVRRCTWWIY